jgi:hypothetical protein
VRDGTALSEIAAILARGYLRVVAREQGAETPIENSLNSPGIALMEGAKTGFMCGSHRKAKRRPK